MNIILTQYEMYVKISDPKTYGCYEVMLQLGINITRREHALDTF